MSNIRDFKFELEAVKDYYTPDKDGFKLYDLIGYDCNIPRRSDGFLEKYCIFRCTTEDMMEAKETEKAIGIDIAGDGGRLAWIPKSVIFDWFPGSRRVPQGFAVKLWFGEKEAQSGGPFFFLPDRDLLELDDGDHATLLSCLLEIGATADEANVTRLLESDTETRAEVWDGIWNKMRGTYKSFDAYWMANAKDIEMKKTANALWHIRSILVD